MNKAILMGRLVKDPVLRRTTSGHDIAEYTLAVDRRVAKGEASADFISCQCWDKKAEFCEKYLHKGIKIVVTGRIQTGSYKDKDGKTVYTTVVVVEDQEFAESKKSQTDTSDGFMPVPDSLEEGLPFN